MANKEISINLGLSELPETTDPRLFNELFRIYNAIRAVAVALDSYTGGLVPDEIEWPEIPFEASYRVQNIARMYVPASELVPAGAMVNLWNDAGTLKARPASATTSRLTQAWNAREATAGEFCLLTFPNSIHSGFSGLTPGSIYWMSATAGFISSTAPATVGHMQQKVGYALSDTSLFFCPTLESVIVPPPPPPDPGG